MVQFNKISSSLFSLVKNSPDTHLLVAFDRVGLVVNFPFNY